MSIAEGAAETKVRQWAPATWYAVWLLFDSGRGTTKARAWVGCAQIVVGT